MWSASVHVKLVILECHRYRFLKRVKPGTYHELDILRLTPFQIRIWVVLQYQRSTESA